MVFKMKWLKIRLIPTQTLRVGWRIHYNSLILTIRFRVLEKLLTGIIIADETERERKKTCIGFKSFCAASYV